MAVTPKQAVAPQALPNSLTTIYTVGTTVAGVTRLVRATLYYCNQAKTASAWVTVKKGSFFIENQRATRTDGRLEAVDLGVVESAQTIQWQASDATSIHGWIDVFEVR